MNKQLIINSLEANFIVDRLASQIFELNFFHENLKILAIQPRGFLFATVLLQRLKEKFNVEKVPGVIDPSFYRDDFSQGSKFIIPKESNVDFEIQNQPVLLIDDIIFTGRTTRAAMNALQDYGRPSWIKILVLVNRHLEREVPTKVDFEGIKIDSKYEQQIQVNYMNQNDIEVKFV